jgi:hypothetical protein
MYTPYPWAYGPFTQKPLIHGVQVTIMVWTGCPSVSVCPNAWLLGLWTGPGNRPFISTARNKKNGIAISSPNHRGWFHRRILATHPLHHCILRSWLLQHCILPVRLTPPASGHRGRSIAPPASPTPPPPRGQPAPQHLDTAATPSHRPAYPNPSGRLPARFHPFPVAARASSCYLRLSLSTAAAPRPSSATVSTSGNHRASVRALH